MDNIIFGKRRDAWKGALKINNDISLVENALYEIYNYFKIDRVNAEQFFYNSRKLFAREWYEMKIDTNNEDSIISFYNKSQFEIFELMHWHTVEIEKENAQPLNYVSAMEIAKKIKAKKYLDFGSGVGSGAILFAKNGFDTTLADISDPLLKFSQYRLKSRKLACKILDVKKHKLPDNYFDLITCFDVIEHSSKPLDIVKKLRLALSPGGILILNNASIRSDKEQPMHVSADIDVTNHLRSLGFHKMWNFKNHFNSGSILVLKKNNYNFIINKLIFLYDIHLPRGIKKTVNIIRKVTKNAY